jgi:hypothetical protein
MTNIASLTFVFSDDSRAPPVYTHSGEPNRYFLIPSEFQIGSLLFGLDATGSFTYLRVLDKLDNVIDKIKGDNKSSLTKVVQFSAAEHIVSAQVEVNGRTLEQV